MICRSPRQSCPPAPVLSDPPLGQQTAYGRPFWLSFVANALVMAGYAIFFRFADFITLLGGTEFHLGWIVGVGMVGSLLVRLALGVGIDQHGPRLIWLGSLVLLSLSCFGHMAVTSCHGPAIYLLRMVFCSSLAGIFGASITFISFRVPVVRMAEIIGMLGTSTFLGMVLGAYLGDFLCDTQPIGRWQVDRMFLVAGTLVGCALPFVALATQNCPRPPRRKRPPLIWLLRRYQPGILIPAGIAAAMGLGLPGVFLRPYTAGLGIDRIALFFGTYGLTTVLVRVCLRRLPARLGHRTMILAGLGGLAMSILSFLAVNAPWQLVIPGLAFGISQAILSPSIVAANGTAFPKRYRGLGTTMAFVSFDFGSLFGAPTAGAILQYSGLLGLPSYPTMFVFMAVVVGAIGVLFALVRQPGKPTPWAFPPTHDRLGQRPSDEPAAAI